MDSSLQAVIEECFTNADRFKCVKSFMYKCRQCTDIADYFAEIGPKFRLPVWQSYLSTDQSKGSAAADFCRAVKEAEVFLQDHCCTSTGKDAWQLCAKGLTKLDTREAYDVHLHNLIWSTASLEVAILYATGGVRRAISSEDIQKLVAECRRVLCRYASSYKERQILLDRVDFNESMESLINANSGEDHKYLAFLLRKSQALELQWRGKNSEDTHLQAFEISDEELVSSKEEELGKGGYAERVYSTLWLGQVRVAVKVILIPDGLDDKAESKAPADEIFKAEVSLLGRLQSPYIVQLIGWAIDRNKKEGKLVTELVATDLGKVLQATENRTGLPLHAAVDLMLQISKAMEYLHKQNVIHRDIKPSNILLEPSSVKGFWRVKLCDFGIGKMKQRDSLMSAKFTTFKMGTSWYRSPEVLSEKANYSPKADVYSFAITCSEILGGSSAALTLRKGEGSLLDRILSNQRPSLPADCPAHLSDLIRKCWNTGPEYRPPFRDITSTLSYIKFVLMRGSAGVEFNAASLLTPFDEHELKACVSGAAHMEAVRAEAAGGSTWDSPTWSINALAENQRPVIRTRRWLQSGESLGPEESLTWGRFRLTMQEDGNLVLCDCDDMKCLWSSGRPTARSFTGLPFVCTLKSTGNLVIKSGIQTMWSTRGKCFQASYKLELDFDGRAIIRSPNGGHIWASDRKVLNSGDSLPFDNSLTNNGYIFCMQSDGNLVLYDERHNAKWASHTNSNANNRKCRCTLQEDGLLVILNGDQLVWSSQESGNTKASYKLELQRDGNVVILHPTGNRIWQTGPAGDYSDGSD